MALDYSFILSQEIKIRSRVWLVTYMVERLNDGDMGAVWWGEGSWASVNPIKATWDEGGYKNYIWLVHTCTAEQRLCFWNFLSLALLHQGDYYPSISTYRNAKVRCNFGPKFRFPPKNFDFRPMSKRADDMAIEQTLSDMKFFTENEGTLRLDNFVMECIISPMLIFVYDIGSWRISIKKK